MARNFSISLVKKILKFFFARNVLKRKEKPKNSRNSTFFSKLSFPPIFEKTWLRLALYRGFCPKP